MHSLLLPNRDINVCVRANDAGIFEYTERAQVERGPNLTDGDISFRAPIGMSYLPGRAVLAGGEPTLGLGDLL